MGTRVCGYRYVCVYVGMDTRVFGCVACVSGYAHTCMGCTHMCMWVWTRVFGYAHMCMWVWTHMYLAMHIHEKVRGALGYPNSSLSALFP